MGSNKHVPGASLWASHITKYKQTSHKCEMLQILENAKTLLNTTRTLILRLKYNSLLWAAIWTLTAAMYTYSVWPLIKMFRVCYKRMEEIKATEQPAMNSKKAPGASKRDRPHERVGIALRRSYIGVHSEHVIVVSEWRALGAWLFLVGGAFSATAMLSQTWRSYIKFDFAQEVSEQVTGLENESETKNKHKWNTLASGSSGNPTLSELVMSTGQHKTESTEDVLVISITEVTRDKIKSQCNIETLRE
ncbi:uncharacterized protein PGTG_12131 [Puccinia graminis f. sp. tritici CRL 75-36-700-3]|uniref:Uncharacterized protein n=1 Tax=Puccinia graminis f. sp. tritici (strain CRL 75-36-700-3 / race SCCL) TaxID=418459 RepID=E3KPF0_PUCGT|nr:uncharacterized protein PGTG_12131 [Puccinia graminis f. sp. tritici CRL 75-36-700-3]EFP86175.2 hypothetical protein PGTG_12131 [Puccinia graminis f. sp. tritici CRL 75-36-700-3]